MKPPPGMNYDLEVGEQVSRDTCTVFTTGYSVEPGDKIETVEFEVRDSSKSVYVRVDTFYPTVFFDPFTPYQLVVRARGDATATTVPTVPMTATTVPTITNTPTNTPSVVPPLPMFTPTPVPTDTPTPGPATATPTHRTRRSPARPAQH